jgi:hypothetical protein
VPAAQLSAEGLLPIPAFARTVGVCRQTAARWVRVGVAVRGVVVRLEAVRVPAGWRTSVAAYRRFLDGLTAAGLGEAAPEPATPAARHRAGERAKQELRKAGWM